MTRASTLLVVLVLLIGAGCGGGDAPTERELAATTLIEAQAGETLECRDNGAVNTELYPEHPVGYSCHNDAGEFYNAVVSADGVVMSLSGPVRLTPADE